MNIYEDLFPPYLFLPPHPSSLLHLFVSLLHLYTDEDSFLLLHYRGLQTTADAVSSQPHVQFSGRPPPG